MLIDIAKQQLKKAGWYEGRKVDLTEYEEGFSNQGCEFFSAAKKFLEEFGDLDIQDKYWSAYSDEHGKKSILINRSIIDPIHCCFKPHEELVERIGKKIVPVGLINFGNIYIYISEDGKFYSDWYNIGLRAENSDQLWNEYYGEDYGWASWEDLKAGRGRTMRKKKVEQYL